ncbi:MAG: CBS domain-containing protein [Anaerolineae bacterium]|nr:CBS domain-containing protein [Anaerolineae bacterium]
MLVALPTHVQLVARSTGDEVDVSQVAARFGGGGHSRAAAALIRDKALDAAEAELIEALPGAVQPRTTVADLMSHGVQTVQAGEPARKVERRMRRTGHEGYPVLDGDRLVGLLTRRAVDRALDHQRGDTPVSELMDAGTFTVEPDDSLEELQQVMLRSGWGQVPVVNGDGVLLGVVTRTDLIKLWGSGWTAASPRRRRSSASWSTPSRRRRCALCARSARRRRGWTSGCTSSAASCATCCWTSRLRRTSTSWSRARPSRW